MPAGPAARERLGQHHVRQPRDAAALVDEREADARAQADGQQHVAGRRRHGDLAHAHRDLAGCGHASDAHAREDLAHAARARAAAGRTASTPRPRRAARSRGSAPCRCPPRGSRARSRRSPRACRSPSAAGVRSSSRPVIAPSEPMYEALRMLPISPRAEIGVLGAGLDAEHAGRACRRRATGKTSRTTASMSPASGIDDAGDLLLRRADGLDGLGERQDERVGHRDVDRAAEHLRQRGAGGAGADVGQLAQGVELQAGERGHGVEGPFGGRLRRRYGARDRRRRGRRHRSRRSVRCGRRTARRRRRRRRGRRRRTAAGG